jgi:hypothetical protein
MIPRALAIAAKNVTFKTGRAVDENEVYAVSDSLSDPVEAV